MTHAPTHAPMTRRTLMIGGATITLTALAAPALGASHTMATMSGTATATVGAREIVALLDGTIPLEIGAFSGATDEELRALIGGDTVEGFINAYVVKGGETNVLIDAGGAGFIPSAGRLPDLLGEAGIEPSSIGTVLMTHLHPDHIGGLLNGLELPEAELVVHERERTFWTSDENMAAAGEGAASFFEAARAVLDTFGDRVTTISGEGDVPGGATSMELFGHTPGHTGYVIADGDESALIWGDIIHAPAIQFPRPGVTISFDVDPEEAEATRRRVLDMAAADDMTIGGMHLVFPGVGKVTRAGEGYGFETMG